MVDPNSIWTGVPSAWTEAYQRCLVKPLAHCGSASCKLRPAQTDGRGTACSCGCSPCSQLSAHLRPPKTSAAERTVPLFDPPFEDEYTAKWWREAYERCLGETVASMANGAPAFNSVSTTEAEMRCPACIDELVRCEACRSFLESTVGQGVVHAQAMADAVNGFLGTTPVAPVQIIGVIPPHVLAELGMHPNEVDEPVRNRACVRAKHEGWSTDWPTLQERAPTGFFTRVLKEMDMNPGERLSVLVDALRARGLKVGAYDAAGGLVSSEMWPANGSLRTANVLRSSTSMTVIRREPWKLRGVRAHGQSTVHAHVREGRGVGRVEATDSSEAVCAPTANVGSSEAWEGAAAGREEQGTEDVEGCDGACGGGAGGVVSLFERIKREFQWEQHESAAWTTSAGGQRVNEPDFSHKCKVVSKPAAWWKWTVKVGSGGVCFRARGYARSMEKGKVACERAVHILALGVVMQFGIEHPS